MLACSVPRCTASAIIRMERACTGSEHSRELQKMRRWKRKASSVESCANACAFECLYMCKQRRGGRARTSAGQDLVLVVRLAVLVLGGLHIEQRCRGHLVGLEATLRDGLAWITGTRSVRAWVSRVSRVFPLFPRREQGASGHAAALLSTRMQCPRVPSACLAVLLPFV